MLRISLLPAFCRLLQCGLYRARQILITTATSYPSRLGPRCRSITAQQRTQSLRRKCLPPNQATSQTLPNLLILYHTEPLGQSDRIALSCQKACSRLADLGIFAVQCQQIDLSGVGGINPTQCLQPRLAQTGIALVQQCFQHRLSSGLLQLTELESGPLPDSIVLVGIASEAFQQTTAALITDAP